MRSFSILASLLVVVALGAVSVNAAVDIKKAQVIECEKGLKLARRTHTDLRKNILQALKGGKTKTTQPAGPANVNCVETGNTAADCLSTCAVATATVTTTKSGTGTACAGDYTCTAGDGACPANVNCVVTGNTAAECLADCTAVAVVSTAQSGTGTACAGDYTCTAGDGACPANVNCVVTGNTAAECLADCTAVAVVSTAQSGTGTACAGDYTCTAGDGACLKQKEKGESCTHKSQCKTNWCSIGGVCSW